MRTGDRVFANPDGEGLRVMEVQGVTVDNYGTLWDGEKIHGPMSLGTHRLNPSNYERYPVGQKFGQQKASV